MKKDDMIICKAAMHILDGTLGFPVLSDALLDVGPDLSDFIKGHLERLSESDDTKKSEFDEASELLLYLKGDYQQEDFITCSKRIANHLYQIMNANVDIPAADLLVVLFRHKGEEYLGILKMNYKTFYTHTTVQGEEGNQNQIIKQMAILPSSGQRLQEAAIIALKDYRIQLLEKKYEVNGEKVNYFSKYVLQCHGPMSAKAKLKAVTKAVEQVDREYYPENDIERKVEVKKVLMEELEEQGSIQVESVREKLFSDNETMKQEFTEKIQKYDLEHETIIPVHPQTTKRLERQVLTTDTGIEVKIPVSMIEEKDKVEFVTNPDGTITLVIKNIAGLITK